MLKIIMYFQLSKKIAEGGHPLDQLMVKENRAKIRSKIKEIVGWRGVTLFIGTEVSPPSDLITDLYFEIYLPEKPKDTDETLNLLRANLKHLTKGLTWQGDVYSGGVLMGHIEPD